jgi:hypothetical protein
MGESFKGWLKLRNAGMFSNVNEVLDNIIEADKKEYKFAVEWKSSPYGKQDNDNAWAYYFEQPYEVDGSRKLGYIETVLGTKKEVVAPHVELVVPKTVNVFKSTSKDTTFFLLPPKDREAVHPKIEKRLNLKNDIKEKVDSFAKKYFDGRVIGVHVRGSGGNHGGSAYFRKLYETEQNVPFSKFFQEVDKQISTNSDTKIFVASDSDLVISRFKNRYGQRLIQSESMRTESGEMHHSSMVESFKKFLKDVVNLKAMNLKQLIDSYKIERKREEIGIDVIVDACLLARTDYLIHGSSNVTNFVLCKNPYLENKFVFQKDLLDLYRFSNRNKKVIDVNYLSL